MDRDGGVQRRRVDELAEAGLPEQRDRVDELAGMLDAESRYVRVRAVELLVAVSESHPAAVADEVDAVAAQLGDEVVGADAARVVANVAAAEPATVEDHLPLLVAVLDSGGAVTEAITAALAAIGAESPDSLAQPGILETLFDLLDDGNAAVRKHATAVVSHVAAVAPGDVVPAGDALRERLDDDSTAVQRNAAAALGSVSKASPAVAVGALKELCGLLEHRNPDVRAAAASALGAMASAAAEGTPEEELLTTLLSGLRADAPVARQHAAFVLAELAVDDPGTVEPHATALARGAVDADPDVRRNLLRALTALETEHPETVEDASDALGETLADAGSAAALRAVAADETTPAPLRRAARDALVPGDREATDSGTKGDSGVSDDADRVCPDCGEEFAPDATFCSVCGTSLE